MSENNKNIEWFREQIYDNANFGYWDECSSSHYEVDTCADAARVRGIKKSEELKSLVLNISRNGSKNNYFVFHLPSDEDIDSFAISEFFKKVRKFSYHRLRLAYKEELAKEFDAIQGTVTPVNKKIWETYSFISPRLQKGIIVSTNDGTLNGWIQFNSKILLSSPKNNVRDGEIFDFSKPSRRIDEELIKATDLHGGLINQAFNQDDLLEKISLYYELSLSNFRKKNKLSDSAIIKINDSFFSDTFDDSFLVKMFQDSRKYGFKIEISLLNPFSTAAELRLKALNSYTRFGRINRGLYKIRKTVVGITEEPFDGEFNNNYKSPEFVFKQISDLCAILGQTENGNIKIRFSNSFPFPLFIISDYAFVSRNLYLISSRESYWDIFSNSGSKINYFNRLLEHHDLFWKKCFPIS